jgi:hypothetical protein
MGYYYILSVKIGLTCQRSEMPAKESSDNRGIN